MVVAVVALHHFAINKGVIFYFTTHCHLLKAALATWNTHARHALNGTKFSIVNSIIAEAIFIRIFCLFALQYLL